MTLSTVTRTVAAPVSRVWALATDIDHAPEYITGIKSVEMLTEAPFTIGSSWRETRHLYGRDATEEITVHDVVPLSKYVVAASSHGCHYVSVFSFREVDSGTTEVTVTLDARATNPLSRVLSRAAAPVLSRSVIDMLAQDLEDLGAACERPEPSSE